MKHQAQQQRATLNNFRASVAITLGEALNAYLDSRSVHPRTRRTETARLASLGRFLGPKSLADVTPQAMKEYFDMRRLVLAPWSIYREACLLHNVFRWFQEQWFIPANPVHAVRVNVPRTSRARILTYPESAELFQQAGTWLIVRVACAHDAGLSVTEIYSLRRRHVDFEQHCIDIHPIKRRVTFSFRFHDLRHTFATRLAAVAQRPRLVQYLLGHHPTTRTKLTEELRIGALLRLHGSKPMVEVTPEMLVEYISWQRDLVAPPHGPINRPGRGTALGFRRFVFGSRGTK